MEMARGSSSDSSEARRRAARARAALNADPANADAWRALGRALRSLGDHEAAEAAELDAIHVSVHDPLLIEAAEALLANDLSVAERLLKPHLKSKPDDVAAIRMLAELAGRVGRWAEAERLLRRALELAPGFGPARANLATVLLRQNRAAEAIEELDALLGDDPENPAHRTTKAAALGRIGGYNEAITLYVQILERLPNQPKIWMSYAHVLKTVGRQAEGIAAYRRAIDLAPQLGEVWWSLANLKTVRFDDADVDAMETALKRPALSDDDRFHLHFALGKALEDRKEPGPSLAHYVEGNRIRRAQLDYDPADIDRQVARAKALFTPRFFAEREGWGCPAPDPIFIVGMPRAGSTLIEQVLASHDAVEGTMELPDMPMLASSISAGGKPLQHYRADEVRALGEDYLQRTRIQRKTDRPFFIDKLPNNWLHAGLIRLILPNAKIVDARRHPLASCFSNFKQHFARGQSFAYALDDVGRYYARYVELMAHVDRALPGFVHRVIYEHMVDDSDSQIRALLAALGLPFQEACLRFWETDRAVRTASSEQVRRPINREGLDQWRPFEPWLDPLKAALGDVLDAYPEVPERLR